MSLTTPIPGLYYSFVRPPAEPSPLRTDVAGFFGRTQRGPVGVATRVEGWREFTSLFGGLTRDAFTPYALRGYFDNGGQVAYVIRLLGDKPQSATAEWKVAAGGQLDADWPGDAHLPAVKFIFTAKSPGKWANGTMVRIRYWALGPSGNPEIEVRVAPPNETSELLSGIDPAEIVDQVNQRSVYVNILAEPLPAGVLAAQLQAPAGPRSLQWDRIILAQGDDSPPSKLDYLDAVQKMGDVAEVALVAAPDLYTDIHDQHPSIQDDKRVEVLSSLLIQAEELHDRLVIIDVPPEQADSISAVNWVQHSLRENPDLQDERRLRNGAVYHPRLLVPDPLGGATNPLRCVPSSGLVAGVISRMDDQLGAYYTPANTEIDDAVDLSRTLKASDQSTLYQGGINLLRCSPGRGLLVWGGRVLGKASLPPQTIGGRMFGQTALGGYVAHRRLIHLLVRAIRGVAEPLVFDINGPELWLRFVRSITSVLLEAFRAGALKGDTPDQAFNVKCDASTNPPENIDLGIVVCEIQVAPAVPMEFILLRVAASRDGKLEVFES